MSDLYRLLLHLYPKSFRHEYGDEMADDFAQALADAGSPGKVGLLLKAVADVGRNAVAVHWNILRQDLRYTARTWNRWRGFALTVILVTALGVGANTAAFSVADFVLLRPLPFPDAEAIVRLCEGPREGGGCQRRFHLRQQRPASLPEVHRLRGGAHRVAAGSGHRARREGPA